MRASLDTNVIIHLYEAELQNILFMRFDEIYVYEHIIFIELKNHASQKIMQNVLQDIELGKIALVTKADLIEKGCWYIFDEYVRENRLIYEYGDLGEVYAIALATRINLPEELWCLRNFKDISGAFRHLGGFSYNVREHLS